jgi:hypothetical protein
MKNKETQDRTQVGATRAKLKQSHNGGKRTNYVPEPSPVAPSISEREEKPKRAVRLEESLPTNKDGTPPNKNILHSLQSLQYKRKGSSRLCN